VRVYIMTCSRLGTAAAVLPELARAERVEIAGIVLNRGLLNGEQQRRMRSRKIRKTIAIGPIGALNGLRMRRWFANASARLGARRLDEQARELGIPMLEVDNLQVPELKPFISSLRCELGLSLGNGYIPKSVFSLTPLGMVNLHHEVLPDFRGAQSVIWQIYEGSDTTGFTIHRIDAGIDTGPIVLVERVPIAFGKSLEETVTATYAELIRLSGIALARVLRNPSLIERAAPQPGGRHYTTPSGLQFLRMLRNHARLRKRSRP
jgi:methionyl-tRNA formyltransferase